MLGNCLLLAGAILVLLLGTPGTVGVGVLVGQMFGVADTLGGVGKNAACVNGGRPGGGAGLARLMSVAISLIAFSVVLPNWRKGS